METLEILFITLPVIALLAAVAVFFSINKDQEYTINLVIEEDTVPVKSPEEEVVVAKPKRRYKRRKKKTPSVITTTVETTIAPKKRPGRPKKTA
jgi:hypothetical protein